MKLLEETIEKGLLDISLNNNFMNMIVMYKQQKQK